MAGVAPSRAPTRFGSSGDSSIPCGNAAGLPAPQDEALYGAAVLDPCPPSLYRRPPAVRRRHVMRPSVDENRAGPTENLQRGRRAYVGFGTVPLFSGVPALIRAVVMALLGLDVDVTVTTGSEELADDVLSLAPERVHAERWVDLHLITWRTEQASALAAAGLTNDDHV